MPLPPVPPPGLSLSGRGLNIVGKIASLTKVVITIDDHLERLDKAGATLEKRLEHLTEKVTTLTILVSEVSGQMKSIEKRLEEKDKLVATMIELQVLKATEKLRAEFGKNP